MTKIKDGLFIWEIVELFEKQMVALTEEERAEYRRRTEESILHPLLKNFNPTNKAVN